MNSTKMKIKNINMSDIDISAIPSFVGWTPVIHRCSNCKYAINRGKAYSQCKDEHIKNGWCYTYNESN